MTTDTRKRATMRIPQHHVSGCGESCCSRCDSPQGEIVVLDGAVRVCGACIDLMGNLLAVAGRVADELTLPSACAASACRMAACGQAA